MSGSWAGGGWERDRGAVTPDRRLAREAVGAAAPRSTRLYVRAGGGIGPSGSRHTPGAEAATALGVCRLLCGLVRRNLGQLEVVDGEQLVAGVAGEDADRRGAAEADRVPAGRDDQPGDVVRRPGVGADLQLVGPDIPADAEPGGVLEHGPELHPGLDSDGPVGAVDEDDLPARRAPVLPPLLPDRLVAGEPPQPEDHQGLVLLPGLGVEQGRPVVPPQVVAVAAEVEEVQPAVRVDLPQGAAGPLDRLLQLGE